VTRSRWLVVVALAAIAAVVVIRFRPREGDRRAKAPPPSAAAPSAAAPASPAAPAPGPTAARVRGKVLDAAGQPIAGAVVRFAQPSSRRHPADPSVTQSGAGGEYQLADLPPGKWTASASASGYLPANLDDIVLGAGEERALDLRLEPGGRVLRGTVSDRTGGAIAGALVEASPTLGLLPGGTGKAAAALTARDGSYTLGLGDGRYRVTAAHPDYVREARNVELSTAGATVDFALLPAGAIEGTVRELGSGAPVPGAIVSHEREAVAGGFLGTAMPVVGRRAGAVIAGADGRFRITGLEPGGIRLEARARGLGSRDKTVVSLGVAEQVSGVELFLGKALAIRGKVVYDDGTPVPGADIEAFGPSGSASTTAGDDGRFALEGLAPATWNLIATGGEGIPGDRARVALRDDDAEVTLTMKRGATVTGRVEPAAPALVRQKLEPANAGPRRGVIARIAGRQTTAGADGSFSLGPLEPGTLRLEARAADGRRGEATVAVGAEGARDVVIKLEEHGGIAGRVVDEQGKPVPGMVVNIARVDGPDSGTTLIINGQDVASTRAPTGPDGSFSALGLEAGSYELTVTDDGGGRVALARGAAPPRVELEANERETGVEIVVERRDGRISGTVLDPEGKPLADAYVMAAAPRLEIVPPPRPAPGQGPGTAMRRVIAWADDSDDLGSATTPVLTDASGRFEITGLRRGKYRVLGEGLAGKARGQLPEVMTGADVTLKLDMLTRLDGKVTAGGKPVSQFTVELGGAISRSQTFRDAGGAFTIDRVDPGKYTVKVVAPEGNGAVDTTIQPGQAATVAIALESHARVVGKVLRADGSPLAGAPVIFAPRQPGGQIRIEMTGDTPTTGADGSFDVQVAAGKHVFLVLGDGPMPAVRKDVEVTVGQVVDLGTLKVEPPPPPPQEKPSLVQAAP
jgi:protocatechuate 3,4-dioxygenase beta subunit